MYESPELNSIDDVKHWGSPRLAEKENEKEKEVNFDENRTTEKGEALPANWKDTSNGFLKCKSLARSDICSSEVIAFLSCVFELKRTMSFQKRFVLCSLLMKCGKE